MAYTLQQLSDLEDIRTLKHRYFRGIDTADLALLGTLFTEDLTVDYRGGTYRVRLEGRDNMLEFLANSFHSGAVAMHHGHMPEITLTDEDSAEGIWYLEDIFIDVERKDHTIGSAIYRDAYRREDGVWKIARTEYDRVFEMIRPLAADAQITSHHLATAGRKPEQRSDISHLIEWEAA
ncbi:nuclear transport factor 2 family protein [Sphingobium agri]|uniref:Nuclear transport factor 2 family protein n=1 Tax=Sphingobium agri TaxID=2933566 RepID=A0ABT0DTT1_9SPHN|nr:nuclear transport factor 2 family protein [Sphingobium agri]MCK0530520.1 nuclear transport factor 2 family protein [Sphingobium agri]